MSHKGLIMMLYGVALTIILSRYYKAGNSGLPKPDQITAPSYLYGVLALTGSFLGALPTVLAAGLTLGLYYYTHPNAESAEAKSFDAFGGTGNLNAAGKPKPQTRTVK